MYEITIENKYGDQLRLTPNPNYVVKATGLSPVNSNIITASVANYGGERYVSSRKQKRNIVLTIYVQGSVETNRIALYKYIKSDDWIRVYYKNGTRDVYIDGYVESFEADLFEQTQTAQVSIICPQPDFIDMMSNEIGNANVTKGFYCPFNTEIKESSGTKLEFTGLSPGIIKFTSFLAIPKTTQLVAPTPDNPSEILSLGTESNGSCSTKMQLNNTTITIPLGEQLDGANLIKGGANLINKANALITNVLIDSDGNILLGNDNDILYD